MKEKFTGIDGQRRLVEVISAQPMIEYNADLAKAFVKAGELIDFAPQQNLTTQGNFENHVFFLLAGETTIYVNGKSVGSRKGGESIGEMFLVSPFAARTATVTANVPVLALRITYTDFQNVAKDFPILWRAVARIAIERLVDKDRLQRLPSSGPTIFLGSSVEGLPVARVLGDGLKHAKSIPKLWSTPGLFSPGGVKFDALLKEVRKSDFAVFVFGPNDKTIQKGPDTPSQRDNVILELGLFMASLDRSRVFIVKEQSSDIKIPADLSGVTFINYIAAPGQTTSAFIAPACQVILAAMEKLGQNK